MFSSVKHTGLIKWQILEHAPKTSAMLDMLVMIFISFVFSQIEK
jgi:hypothetical protein